MPRGYFEETRAIARLPNLDIEIVHGREADGALLHGEFQERSLGFITRIMRFSWRNGRNPDDRPQACDSEPRRRWRLRSVDLQRTLPEVAGQ